MSKAVMRSLAPQVCERIANGKQTMLVVKQQPKLKTPYKEYIYCTKKKYAWHCSTPIKGNPHGKVIGEYIVDKIEPIACHKYNNGVGVDYSYYTDRLDCLYRDTRLSDYALQEYLGVAGDGQVVGYGLHISNLVIYDKPKELGEFIIVKHIRGYHKKNEPQITGLNKESIEVLSHSNRCEVRKLTRPPQSYFYVEEV